LDAPVIYGNAYKTLELHNAPKKMHHDIKKNGKVIFNYKLKHPIKTKEIALFLDDGYNTWTTRPTEITINHTSLKLEHQFKKKGFYDVHLYISDNLISTYTVEVTSD